MQQETSAQHTLFRERDTTTMTRILDGALTTVLSSILLFLPFFFLGNTAQGILFEKYIFIASLIALALALWLFAGIVRGVFVFRRSPIDIVLLLLWSVLIVATIHSTDTWHSIVGSFGDPSRGLIAFTSIFIFYSILFNHLNDRRAGIFLVIYICASLGSAFLALLFVFAPDLLLHFGGTSGINMATGNLSSLTTLIGTNFFFFVALLFLHRRAYTGTWSAMRYGVIFALIIAVSVHIILLYYFAYALSIVSFAFVIVLLLFFFMKNIGLRRHKMVFLVAVGAFSVLLAIVGWQGQTTQDSAQKFSWHDTKETVQTASFFGMGLATHGPHEVSEELPTGGLFVYFFDTAGFLGVGAFLLFCFLTAFIVLHDLVRHTKDYVVFTVGLVISVIFFLCSSIFVYADYTVMLSCFFLCAFMFFFVLRDRALPLHRYTVSLQHMSVRIMGVLLVSTFLCGSLFFLGHLFLADYFVAKSVATQEQLPTFEKYFSMAEIFNDNEASYDRIRAQIYLTHAHNAQKNGQELLRDEYVQKLFKALEYHQEKNTHDSIMLTIAAQGYELKKEYAQAQALYEKILVDQPKNQSVQKSISRLVVLHALDPEQEAKKAELLERAAQTLSQFRQQEDVSGEIYELSGIVAQQQGGVDGAINFLEQARHRGTNNQTNTMVRLAILYHERGHAQDLAKAEALFEGVLDDNDNILRTHFSLGLLYEQQGKIDEAIRAYEEVYAQLPQQAYGMRESITQVIENLRKGHRNTNLYGAFQ